MTTVEALFDVYDALGGDVDEISTLETIPDLLEEISEQIRKNKLSEEEQTND